MNRIDVEEQSSDGGGPAGTSSRRARLLGMYGRKLVEGAESLARFGLAAEQRAYFKRLFRACDQAQAFIDETRQRFPADGSGQADADLASPLLRAREPDLIQATNSPQHVGPENDPVFDTPRKKVEQRLEAYGPAHRRAEQMADWLSRKSILRRVLGLDTLAGGGPATLEDLAAKLNSCGTWLVFHRYDVLAGQNLLAAGRFCDTHLLCPFCALRRASKNLRAYCPKMLQALEEHGGRGYLVTFTVKNGPDLLERFGHLRKSLDELHRHRRRCLSASAQRRRYAATEAIKAHGAVWSYEAKRGGGSGDWHPHVHAVWLCQDAPDQEALRSEWYRLTKDSYQVDVRAFHCSERLDAGGLTPSQAAQLLGNDAAEVFKYALKIGGLEYVDNYQAWAELRGRRLIGSFGSLYGVKVDEFGLDALEDLETAAVDVEDLPYVEVMARYLPGLGSYSVEEGEVPVFKPALRPVEM